MRNFTDTKGKAANVIHFAPLETTQIKIILKHRGTQRSGLTEIEAWGDTTLPVKQAPLPAGNLSFNAGNQPFPKASASYTCHFDKVEFANDGIINYNETPNNRWTSFESKNKTDWLQIDFGAEKKFSRVELAIYDDHGGVQAPEKYTLEYLVGDDWKEIPDQTRNPQQPGPGMNTITFAPVLASKMRVVFTHKGQARSGVTELMVWEK